MRGEAREKRKGKQTVTPSITNGKVIMTLTVVFGDSLAIERRARLLLALVLIFNVVCMLPRGVRLWAVEGEARATARMSCLGVGSAIFAVEWETQ